MQTLPLKQLKVDRCHFYRGSGTMMAAIATVTTLERLNLRESKFEEGTASQVRTCGLRVPCSLRCPLTAPDTDQMKAFLCAADDLFEKLLALPLESPSPAGCTPWPPSIQSACFLHSAIDSTRCESLRCNAAQHLQR